jgi:ectoine hydroxylase-related dioxygenase (phytanoyl-CoA dioxygenase family)
VIKNPDVVEGLSDLPWHRDCGLGGHPITCPTINIGLQLDAATAETGRLHVVPGTWRFSCHRRDLDRAPAVAIDTEPGDCTVHFGDVMHAAPPPTGAGPGRRAIYTRGCRRAYEPDPARGELQRRHPPARRRMSGSPPASTIAWRPILATAALDVLLRVPFLRGLRLASRRVLLPRLPAGGSRGGSRTSRR